MEDYLNILLSITQKLELLEKNIDYGKIDYLREKVKIFLNYKPPNYIENILYYIFTAQ